MVRNAEKNIRECEMRLAIVAFGIMLSGCTVMPNSEVNKSISRDQTMEKMAKTALINEMLNSPDPHVRAKGAQIAEKFLIEPKKNIFGF